MCSLFWRYRRVYPLSPDLHFLSCPALACLYPRQNLWLNPSYDYKYDAKKRDKTENVNEFGHSGVADISLFNIAMDILESYSPPNGLLLKIFLQGSMIPSVWYDIEIEGRHEEEEVMYQHNHIPCQEGDVWHRSVPCGMVTPPGLVHRCQRQLIREVPGLKRSLFIDSSFVKSEIRAMSKNWVEVEYYPNIIDVEVDEAIELLENVTFFTSPWLVIKMSLNKYCR